MANKMELDSQAQLVERGNEGIKLAASDAYTSHVRDNLKNCGDSAAQPLSTTLPDLTITSESMLHSELAFGQSMIQSELAFGQSMIQDELAFSQLVMKSEQNMFSQPGNSQEQTRLPQPGLWNGSPITGFADPVTFPFDGNGAGADGSSKLPQPGLWNGSPITGFADPVTFPFDGTGSGAGRSSGLFPGLPLLGGDGFSNQQTDINSMVSSLFGLMPKVPDLLDAFNSQAGIDNGGHKSTPPTLSGLPEIGLLGLPSGLDAINSQANDAGQLLQDLNPANVIQNPITASQNIFQDALEGSSNLLGGLF